MVALNRRCAMFGLTSHIRRADKPDISNDELRTRIAKGSVDSQIELDRRMRKYSAAAKMNKENMRKM